MPGNRRVSLFAVLPIVSVCVLSAEAVAQVSGSTRGAQVSGAQESRQGSERPRVPSELQALIERADRAWDALDSVAFEFEARARGLEQVVAQMPRASGELLIAPNEERQGSVRAAGTGRVGEEGEDRSFDLSWDASGVSWLDHEAKRLLNGARPTGFSGQMGMTIMLPALEALRGPSPLASLASRAERVMPGPAVEVDGQTCEVVVFMMGSSGYRFAIAPDGLPRQVTLQLQMLSQEITLRQPDTSRNLGASAFAIRAPEGYTEAVSADAPAGRPVTRQRMTIEPGGAQPISDQPTQRPQANEADAPQPIDIGTREAAPAFELKTPDGDTISLADLRGRVVVLDFWGTWCLPCKLSSPLVQKLHEDYEDKPVTVLGLAVRERDLDKPAQYMDENGYTYTILLEADAVATEYRVRAFPSFVVIGPHGELLHMARGFHPENNNPFERIREIIDRQLAAMGE